MFDEETHKIPIGRAILWIFLSTLFTSGTVLMGWLFYINMRDVRSHDPQYKIIAIMQSSPQKESLKTAYLVEWLNLSLDKPANLYQFDVKNAENRLLESPLIKQASIRKIRPGALYLEYQTRIPIAYLGDYTNTAVDEEGYLIPFNPFFTPKKIPILYLGLENTENLWGGCMQEDKRFRLAYDLLSLFKEKKMNIKQIDISRAYADSYGQKQIVVVLDQEKGNSFQRHYLRLNTEHFFQSLSNYLTLRDYLIDQPENLSTKVSLIIDLRIPHLAFIKKEN